MTSTITKLLAKGKPDYTALQDHLYHVSLTAVRIAEEYEIDRQLAKEGAILHDLGKGSPLFQRVLVSNYRPNPTEKPFRHEIASLLFLPLFPKDRWPDLIDMVVAHHKSIESDVRHRGILDLEFAYDEGVNFEYHATQWEEWSPLCIQIVQNLGINIKAQTIKKEDAQKAYEYVVEYCEGLKKGVSRYKGLLMAADHFASAMIQKTEIELPKLFQKPNLAFYNRKHSLYPLSAISSDHRARHTLVTAPTGAGKTDFLLRRCRGRVFYTLPFQASINAMYRRIKSDLEGINPNLSIYPLHASSKLIMRGKSAEDQMRMGLVGASIKVLTPHQLASIAFATRGYEALLLDLEGCDVILDEIHTYTNVTQAMVLSVVEVLKYNNCRIHIGTATMPSQLYTAILELLGKEEVYEVSLSENVLQQFDRHTIHKEKSLGAVKPKLLNALEQGEKVLLIANQVKTSQQWMQEVMEWLEDATVEVPTMLLHSRFKRKDRQRLEHELQVLNSQEGGCLVVSTQVVEVSLDISFDRMFTACAPIDSLVQRFGRVNRKRSPETIGNYKPIHIFEPPQKEKDALPYSLEVLERSYEVLPSHGEVFEEAKLQQAIDEVFPELAVMDIANSVMFREGKWRMKKLRHQGKSVLLEKLDIDSVACITQKDQEAYEQADWQERPDYEIPMRYRSVGYKELEQSRVGQEPFIVPDTAYDELLGLRLDKALPKDYANDNQFL